MADGYSLSLPAASTRFGPELSGDVRALVLERLADPHQR
jgi:hypothetical protein